MKHEAEFRPGTDAFHEMAESCGEAVIGCSKVGGIVENVMGRMVMLGEKRTYLERIARDLSDEQEQVVAATATARALSQKVRGELAGSVKTVRISVSDFQAIIELMLELGEDIAGFAEAMDQVVKASEQIDTIAKSTNMLALNAAIEAQRAGAAGAAFAVVASEVKKLALDTRQATDRISSTMGSLGRRADAFVSRIGDGVDRSRNAQHHVETISSTVDRAIKMVSDVDRKTDEIAQASANVRANTGELCDNLFVFMSDVDRCASDLETGLGFSRELEHQHNDMFDKLLHSGMSAADNPFVELAMQGRDEVARLIGKALKDGTLAADALFDREYVARNEPGIERFDTRFNEFADSVIQPVLDRYEAMRPGIHGAVITNEDGYLPTHISRRTRTPTGDKAHDDEYCRNRLKLLDHTTAEAVRRKDKPFYAAVYRFDHASGAFEVVRNIFVPLWFDGRYWGNFELAYAIQE
ncbi:MAG: methyl-accepting chemotaxis protein [Blastomonas sp.]